MAENLETTMTVIAKTQIPLFPGSVDRADGMLARLFKSQGEEAPSKQGVNLGLQEHPYDFAQVKSFSTGNEHHSACIHTKVAATVGLGFIDSEESVVVEDPVAEATPPVGTDPASGLPAQEMLPMPKTKKQFTDSKVDLALNPLCMISATDLLHDICEDFWQTGNGLMEVVRPKNALNEIVGLHHLPSEEGLIHLEDTAYNFHFVIKTGEGPERRFARFGDWEDFEKRVGAGLDFSLPEQQVDGEFISEVIHFRQPTSRSRWYGFAKWLAAVPPIELAQMLMQWKYDFFLNRGVPEFIFLLTGQKLKADDWKKIEDALKANIGLGNSHKSLALNISNPEVKATIAKLAAESKGEDTFATTKEALALSVVTAHQVPPLLAGIQIPGKLGATNELPNALMAFQLLVIGPAQRQFQQTLATTLGADNGVEGLSGEDFAFTKITEEIDMGSMDTVSRMRQTVPEAEAEGRNPEDGLKE